MKYTSLLRLATAFVAFSISAQAAEVFKVTTVAKSYPVAVAADFNGSGFVDASDLLFIIDRWGESGEGDLNDSGYIDVGDVLTLIDAWGLCS